MITCSFRASINFNFESSKPLFKEIIANIPQREIPWKADESKCAKVLTVPEHKDQKAE